MAKLTESLDSSANSRGWLYNPLFPTEWPKASLFSLAEWTNGLAFRDFQFSPRGRPVIKIAEVKNGIAGQTDFTEQQFDSCYFVQNGDMLFAWSGQPETSIDVYWWRGTTGWLNQHMFKVKPREFCHFGFFYYLLKYLKPNFIAIARNKQTTGLGHVTIKDLQAMTVAVPKLATQKAIASFLGSLDDTIELNRRMNETLEAMARAIFKSWFVDFDPVHAKMEGRKPVGMDAETAALFRDSFQDSPLGMIPKAWSPVSLYEVADYINGDAFRSEDFSDNREGLPIVKIAELKEGISKQTKFTTRQREDRYRLHNGVLLFSWSGSPDTSIDTFIYTFGDAWLNQHIFRVVPKTETEKPFVYYLLKHMRPQFVEIARNKQTTGLGHVTVGDLKRVMIPHPSQRTLTAFSGYVGPFLQRTYSSIVESQQLAAIRDALLPKLLSGEIRVKDAKHIAGRAV